MNTPAVTPKPQHSAGFVIALVNAGWKRKEIAEVLNVGLTKASAIIAQSSCSRGRDGTPLPSHETPAESHHSI